MSPAVSYSNQEILSCTNKYCLSPAGAKVPADAGCEERPCEVLEASDPADGFKPPQQRRPHHLHQRHQKERPLRARTRPAGRSQ